VDKVNSKAVASDDNSVQFARSPSQIRMISGDIIMRHISSALSIAVSVDAYEDAISSKLKGISYEERITTIR
jgi:hypothetical protein